jgi:site-specific DNA-methyltransferase (adenine-specific)
MPVPIRVTVHHGDCLEIVPTLGLSVDAVVTDPPYLLVPTLKRFGAADSAPAQHGRDGAMARLSGGFMGQQWDGGDIAFRPETWATIGSALRPGGLLVAFGGTRTYHRLTCAIEDAGFVIQDCLMWLFATGFPKRRDMLKPAYEPIVLAYKPGGKRTMQVDECRIATAQIGAARDYEAREDRESWRITGGSNGSGATSPLGRWPANVLTDGSDEVVAAFPESTTNSTGSHHTGEYSSDGITGWKQGAQYGSDTGSAARFFFSAKAGAQDRWGSRHHTVKPVELMKWLVALVCPPGGTVLDPFAGSGTTGAAALATGREAILIEREAAYCDDIRERLAFYTGEGRHSLSAKSRRRTQSAGSLL